MADQAYCGERLMAELDGARLVKYDTAGYLYAWFGGHGIHVYNAAGVEVDYWMCGDFATNEASIEDVEESIAHRILNLDDLISRAEDDGYDAGKAAGSWLLDGNSTEDAARRLLQGIEDGDPEIMDELPCGPLSGEWAADPTSRSILAGFAGTDAWDSVFTDEEAEEILSAYEDGYSRGVQDEAARSARALLGSS